MEKGDGGNGSATLWCHTPACHRLTPTCKVPTSTKPPLSVQLCPTQVFLPFLCLPLLIGAVGQPDLKKG